MPDKNIKRGKPPNKESTFNPPQHEIQAFARCILPAIQAYFESEEGQLEFKKWKAKKQK